MFFKFKNNIISIFTFFTLLLLPITTTVMINHTLTNQTIINMERGFFGNNTYSIAIHNKNFHIDDLLQFIDVDDIAVYHDYDENVREIVYTNKFAYFPMISGRFFNPKDFSIPDNYAVVGKLHKNDIFEKNNKSYITIAGTDYEVIGIFGTDIDTMFDDKILINNPIAKESQSMIFYIDCFFKDSNNIVFSIIENLKIAEIDAKQISTETAILSNIVPNILYSRWFVLLIVCELICVILLSIEWIHTKKKEIAVKQLLGNSNTMIMFNTCLWYIFTVAISFIGGLMLSCLIYPQHTQYIWQSIAIIIPLAIIILIICYVCIKRVSIEEAIK